MDSLVWVDWAMFGGLTLSALVGLRRGLVFELMSLVGWVVAYGVAQAYSAQLGAFIPMGSMGPALHQALAYFASFVLALLLWAVLARLVRQVIHASPLTVPDRALGAAFGLLRGLVVLLAVATLVAFTPAVRSPAWADSHGAAWLATLLRGLQPFLPPEVSRHLPS